MSIWEFGITHPLWARPAELFSRLSVRAHCRSRRQTGQGVLQAQKGPRHKANLTL
jgi:hypothetical protein